jgi:hypothetical protein
MDVEEWTVYRTRFLVRARQLTESLFFTDPLGREHSGIPGDYLVESSLGSRSITPRAIFEDVYVPIPQHDVETTRPPSQGSVRTLEQAMTRRPRPMERRPPRPDHHYNSSPDRQVPSWSG